MQSAIKIPTQFLTKLEKNNLKLHMETNKQTNRIAKNKTKKKKCCSPLLILNYKAIVINK